LPDIPFPEGIELQADLATVLQNPDILITIPSDGFREILLQIKSLAKQPLRLVWGTKGLDPTSQQLLSEVTQEILGNIPMAALSGPSFAKEVAKNMPTAVTIACQDKQFSQDLMQYFHGQNFRVYLSDDLIGVQIAGAVKNVIALAVGASDGLGLGANTRAALITRGLAEMARLGVALGAKQETFMGLAGIGDLVLTATDNQSRNRRFGLALGQGKNLQQAQAEIGQVVESVSNTKQVYQLAKQHKVEMPIVEQLYQILYQNIPIQTALQNLLTRPSRAEM
jgi:glycerol-3-phosphate dehydrogenase (NAD(P)+)